MATDVKRPTMMWEGHEVSELGYRLRLWRKLIEEAAARGETKLLNEEELEAELEQLRRERDRYSDLP